MVICLCDPSERAVTHWLCTTRNSIKNVSTNTPPTQQHINLSLPQHNKSFSVKSDESHVSQSLLHSLGVMLTYCLQCFTNPSRAFHPRLWCVNPERTTFAGIKVFLPGTTGEQDLIIFNCDPAIIREEQQTSA